MAPPSNRKVIAGTLAAAISLTAGVAIASDDNGSADEPKLDDVVLVRDVSPPEWSAADIVPASADTSVASPFESMESVDSLESAESLDSAESVDSLESAESLDSAESVDSLESMDSVESMDSPDSVDSP